MSLKFFMDKVFMIPPFEQRVDIADSYYMKLFTFTDAYKKRDDVYVYYQCLKGGFITGILIGVMFLYVFCTEKSLSFAFFEIKYMPVQTSSYRNFIPFMHQYSDVLSSIFLYLLFPFFLVKLRWNVNSKKYESIWDRNAKMKVGWYIKRFFLFLSTMLTMLFLLRGAGNFWGFLTEFLFLKTSAISVGLYFIFYAYVAAIAIWGLVVGTNMAGLYLVYKMSAIKGRKGD